MDIEKLLLQENVSFLKKMMDKIIKKPKKTFKQDLIQAIAKVAKEAKKQGLEAEVMTVINKHHTKRISNLSQLINPAKQIKEGFKDFFGGEAIKNAYGALSFYPILMMFLELDKVFRGAGGDLKISLVYLTIWLAVISGKAEASNILTNLYQKSQAKQAQMQQDAEAEWEKSKRPIGFRT
jgi:hypothetical protein